MKFIFKISFLIFCILELTFAVQIGYCSVKDEELKQLLTEIEKEQESRKTLYCEKCLTIVPKSSDFCPYCGAPANRNYNDMAEEIDEIKMQLYKAEQTRVSPLLDTSGSYGLKGSTYRFSGENLTYNNASSNWETSPFNEEYNEFYMWGSFSFKQKIKNVTMGMSFSLIPSLMEKEGELDNRTGGTSMDIKANWSELTLLASIGNTLPLSSDSMEKENSIDFSPLTGGDIADEGGKLLFEKRPWEQTQSPSAYYKQVLDGYGQQVGENFNTLSAIGIYVNLTHNKFGTELASYLCKGETMKDASYMLINKLEKEFLEKYNLGINYSRVNLNFGFTEKNDEQYDIGSLTLNNNKESIAKEGFNYYLEGAFSQARKPKLGERHEGYDKYDVSHGRVRNAE